MKKDHREERTAHYHLPGLFEFYELYRVFLPLYRQHREYFYSWCDIGSIYGAPAGCLWGGGRVSDGEADPRQVLALMQEYGISARLTFSNSLLQPEHLTDKTCNALCALLEEQNEPQNGVIVHSDLLLRYLQEHYPKLYLVSSTTKVLTEFPQLQRELAREAFRYVVPDFRLNKAFDFNVEALANGVSDRWNRRDDHSFDSYYNVLVGITYKFGTGFNLKCPDCKPVAYRNERYSESYVKSLNDKINELQGTINSHKCPEPVPCPEVEKSVPGIKSHVSFGLAKTDIAEDQQVNILAIADYMKQYPRSKATITGYADKGTGSAKVNAELAKKRARMVADELINRYGISADRLNVDSKGSEVQPFTTNDWNRVVIMIAE